MSEHAKMVFRCHKVTLIVTSTVGDSRHRGSLQAELFDPVTECPETNAEKFRRGGLVVTGLLQRFHDSVTLDLY